MAPEEAIKYLRQIYPNGYHCWLDSQRIEAIEMAIMALSKPSLPSNLDEAAEKYSENILANNEDLQDAIEDAFKAGAGWRDTQIPKLPDSLDEAAEEYAYNNWEDNDYHTGASEGLPFDAIGHTEKCFKAGAEWMAGQFQKIEGDLVDWYSTSDGKDYCCGVKTIDAFEVPKGFYIRKKQ